MLLLYPGELYRLLGASSLGITLLCLAVSSMGQQCMLFSVLVMLSKKNFSLPKFNYSLYLGSKGLFTQYI